MLQSRLAHQWRGDPEQLVGVHVKGSLVPRHSDTTERSEPDYMLLTPSPGHGCDDGVSSC